MQDLPSGAQVLRSSRQEPLVSAWPCPAYAVQGRNDHHYDARHLALLHESGHFPFSINQTERTEILPRCIPDTNQSDHQERYVGFTSFDFRDCGPRRSRLSSRTAVTTTHRRGPPPRGIGLLGSAANRQSTQKESPMVYDLLELSTFCCPGKWGRPNVKKRIQACLTGRAAHDLNRAKRVAEAHAATTL